MGMMHTEQAVRIIEATGGLVQRTQPKPDHIWLIVTGIVVPVILVILGWWLKGKGKK